MKLESEIVFPPQGDTDVYYVIGNFETVHDQALDKIFNIQSGLNEPTFYKVFEDFASSYGLSVEHRCTDSMVLKGPEGLESELRQMNGSRFSYAVTDEQGLDCMLQAEVDFRISDEESAFMRSGRFSDTVQTTTLDS